MGEPRKDLLCSKCAEREAEFLLIWRKCYPEGEAILDPCLLCKPCSEPYHRKGVYFEGRSPELLGFKYIIQLDPKRIGSLTSSNPKWYFENHLSYKFWREKIWRIKKACVPEKVKI